MTSSTERVFSSLLARLLEVRLSGRDSVSEYLCAAKFGAVQGQLGALEDLGVITWDQLVLLTDLLLNASKHAGEPFPSARNVGPVMPANVSYVRRYGNDVRVKPAAQVPSSEPVTVPAPASRPELRLLCLLVKDRSGGSRSLPIHTMRPLPPRVGPVGRWSLVSDAAFYLRETRAERPSPEVLARYSRQRQTNAVRADSRAV